MATTTAFQSMPDDVTAFTRGIRKAHLFPYDDMVLDTTRMACWQNEMLGNRPIIGMPMCSSAKGRFVIWVNQVKHSTRTAISTLSPCWH